MSKHILTILLLTTFLHHPVSGQMKGSDGVDRVIIIRHGEKPPEGDNLSCRGLNRALQLANVIHQKFGVPDRVYVPAVNTGKSTSAARMYQTIVPFAVKYNIEVNTKFEVKETNELVESIKKKKGSILVCWEHKAISDFVKALGIKGQNWDDNDFDSIWIITFPHGNATLAKDRENIHPADTCP